VLVEGQREWRTLHDIDTGAGALPYTRLTGDEDYVAYFARRALESGAGRTGRLGDATAHVFEARPLVEGTIARIEAAFGPAT
jgi:hypothetical protein